MDVSAASKLAAAGDTFFSLLNLLSWQLQLSFSLLQQLRKEGRHYNCSSEVTDPSVLFVLFANKRGLIFFPSDSDFMGTPGGTKSQNANKLWGPETRLALPLYLPAIRKNLFSTI
jgi:hypothetical protein